MKSRSSDEAPPFAPPDHADTMFERSDPRMTALLARDRRYRFEAYEFLDQALVYAQEVLNLGAEKDSEPTPGESQPESTQGRHLTGQELCEAIRLLALRQFGYMAKCVLNSWGVTRTGDFGEMVYNLIEAGLMRKTRDDRREDFDDVFDFDSGLCDSFQITMPD